MTIWVAVPKLNADSVEAIRDPIYRVMILVLSDEQAAVLERELTAIIDVIAISCRRAFRCCERFANMIRPEPKR